MARAGARLGPCVMVALLSFVAVISRFPPKKLKGHHLFWMMAFSELADFGYIIRWLRVQPLRK
jgi:hypothetical protein